MMAVWKKSQIEEVYLTKKAVQLEKASSRGGLLDEKDGGVRKRVK
jgi:hypothetical protein